MHGQVVNVDERPGGEGGEAREADRNADGRVVHPYEIIAILGKAAPWIREFQLVQERMDLVRLRLVPSASPAAAELAGLEQAIRTFLGRDVTVRVEAVDEIRLEPNAKLRVCRSLVTSEYDAIDGGRAGE